MDGKALQEKLLKLITAMESTHKEWWSIWQDAYDYVLKKNVTIGSDTNSVKPNKRVFDETASEAVRTAADGMEGHVTPPTVPWFRIKPKKRLVKMTPEIQQWLSDVEKVLSEAISNSNFYQAINEVLQEGAGVGTGILYVDEDLASERVRFIPRSVHECLIAQDAFGKVDTVVRTFQMSLARAWEFFGDDFPPKLAERAAVDGEQMIEVRHWVGPADSKTLGKDPIKTPGGQPIASIYMIPKESPEPILISGYDSFPYVVWRWSTRVNDAYGWGPGLTGINTIKTANLIAKALLDGAQLATTPPVAAFASGNTQIDLAPNAITFIENNDARVEKIDLVGSMPITAEYLQMIQEQIRKLFYYNTFLMLAQQTREMTTIEVNARQGENAAILAAVIGRMGNELLSPIIDRVFEIVKRQKGILPPPPVSSDQVRAGQAFELSVDFVGPLAMAQHRVHATWGIKNGIMEGMAIAQLNPQVLINIDHDKTYRRILEDSGFPVDLILGEQDVLKMKEAQAQAQSQMQQVAAAQVQADIYKKTTKSPEPGSPAAQQLGVDPAIQQAQAMGMM